MLSDLHLDVLTSIGVQTVAEEFGPPALRSLLTINSLQLTCRHIYESLSIHTNTALYGRIFAMMWDIEPLRRRFPSRCTTTSSLTMELRRRFNLLKKIQHLRSNGMQAELSVSDLASLLFWMTEDDGRNSFQVHDILGLSDPGELCFSLLSRKGLFHNAPRRDLSIPNPEILMALMWISIPSLSFFSFWLVQLLTLSGRVSLYPR